MGISRGTRRELLAVLAKRYAGSSKQEKTRVLDEVVALTGCHRKHAVRLMKTSVVLPADGPRTGRKVYDEAVREALIMVWEAADRICGKRLVAVLPAFVESLEKHGRLALELSVRSRLLSMSAATIDRMLAPARHKAMNGRRHRRLSSKPSQKIATRTFGDWDDPAPGFFEIDFVAHCGGSMAGTYLHSLVATDVASGWTEALSLLAREQSLVVAGLEALRDRLPMPLLGIDSDNDSAFINDTLVSYCKERSLEFTRSRPYRKNDQAWIEQKNGAIIRRFVGHERLSGVVAGRALARLHELLRSYVNYFQPSFKLLEKSREGSKVRRKYHKPATPCERLLADNRVPEDLKEKLRQERNDSDPVSLLHQIREAQSALAALVLPEPDAAPDKTSLDEFLDKLPKLWRAGDSRPTRRGKPNKKRTWRTREDPFAGVWSQVLKWLEESPDATAKSLFERLQREYPDRFQPGQLRTLQRRIGEWRHVMARELIYASSLVSAGPDESVGNTS